MEAQVPQTEALWLQPNWTGPLKSAPGPGSGLELVESVEEAPGWCLIALLGTYL